MENYRTLDQEQFFNLRKAENVDGLQITVRLSPYETPCAVAELYDGDGKKVRISFRYIDSEPGVQVPGADGVTFVEGRHTGKLLSISVPIDVGQLSAADVDGVRYRALEAIRKRRATFKEAVGRRLNFDAAKTVIHGSMGEFSSQLQDAR